MFYTSSLVKKLLLLQKSECPESAERVQRNLVGILLGWGLFRTKDAEGEEIKSLFGKSLIELLVQTKDSGRGIDF